MRKSVFVVLLALATVVVTAPAKMKKKASLSQLLCQARYVSVETYEGAPDANLARQYPLDYDAAVGVQQRIQKWGRYTLVNENQQADLVLVVWRARPQGNRLPGPTQMPPVRGPQIPDPGTGQNPQGMPGQNPQGMPGQNPGGMGGPDGVGVSNGGRGVATDPPNDELAVYQPQSDESLQSSFWKKSERAASKIPT